MSNIDFVGVRHRLIDMLQDAGAIRSLARP